VWQNGKSEHHAVNTNRLSNVTDKFGFKTRCFAYNFNHVQSENFHIVSLAGGKPLAYFSWSLVKTLNID